MVQVAFAHLLPVDCSIGIRLENCCKSIKGQTDKQTNGKVWDFGSSMLLKVLEDPQPLKHNISSFNTFAGIDNQASEGFAQQFN